MTTFAATNPTANGAELSLDGNTSIRLVVLPGELHVAKELRVHLQMTTFQHL